LILFVPYTSSKSIGDRVEPTKSINPFDRHL
jgi:hypothetical protein